MFGDQAKRYDVIVGRMKTWRQEILQKLGIKKTNLRLKKIESDAWKEKDRTEAKVNKPGQFFQTDIVLTPDQMDLIDQSKAYTNVLSPTDSEKIEGENSKKRKRATITNSRTARWAKIIPYSFDSTLRSQQTQNVIRQAVQFWQRETCLNFVENGSGTDRLSFFAGSGCYSSVGRTGGQQGISIGTGCEYVKLKLTC